MTARPNVVVIVADTFRRDHMGAYGNPYIRTPHLDEFARSAAVFDHHVGSSFPTMPARADILSGTFSYTHVGWEPLPRHLFTLPEVLSKAGYTTMGVVDTPFFVRNGFGYDRGFDDFIWVRGQGDDTRPHERADARTMWRSESDRLVARTVTEAENWLERDHDERFFLYIDTWDPHEPWDAPDYYTKGYRESYAGEQLYPCYGKWEEAGLSRDEVDLAHATYCGEVTMVDFWVGRLLDKLDALNLSDSTLVFFTSDHGFYFGEHGHFGKAEWLHAPYRHHPRALRHPRRSRRRARALRPHHRPRRDAERVEVQPRRRRGPVRRRHRVTRKAGHARGAPGPPSQSARGVAGASGVEGPRRFCRPVFAVVDSVGLVGLRPATEAGDEPGWSVMDVRSDRTAEESAKITPRLSYLICATARSGSTLLCAVLDGTGIAGRPAEHFEVLLETGHPRQPRDYFQRSNDPEVWALLDDPELRDVLGEYGGRYARHPMERAGPPWRPPNFEGLVERALREGTTENGVLGTKIMWSYLRDFVRLARRTPGLEGVPPCDVPAAVLPNLGRYVWIRRRDTTRQAVSLWKALQTRQWRRDSDEHLGAEGLRFSFPAINHLKLRIDEHNAAWQAFFDGCGEEPIKVVYEDLVGDYDGTVRRVLDGLGIPAPRDLIIEEPKMRRQADELSEEWVRLYDEQEAARTTQKG